MYTPLQRVASNPDFSFQILSCSCVEKLEGKPGRVSYMIRWHFDINLPTAKATHHTNIRVIVSEGKNMLESRLSPRRQSYLACGLFVHQACLQQLTGYFSSHSFAEMLRLMYGHHEIASN